MRGGLGVVGVMVAGALFSASAGPAGAVGLPRPGFAWTGDRLTVAYDDGSGKPAVRTLACGAGAAAATRDVRDACARLEAVGGPVGPVPEGQMCSMVYGGPQTAHVTGRWHGRPVDETYRRTDGCEVARWNRMMPALPAPGPMAQPGPGPGAEPGGGVHTLAT